MIGSKSLRLVAIGALLGMGGCGTEGQDGAVAQSPGSAPRAIEVTTATNATLQLKLTLPTRTRADEMVSAQYEVTNRSSEPVTLMGSHCAGEADVRFDTSRELIPNEFAKVGTCDMDRVPITLGAGESRSTEVIWKQDSRGPALPSGSDVSVRATVVLGQSNPSPDLVATGKVHVE